ncbi:MAG: glutathione S-transferase family protein [Deltaproteobacteria bacterium]|nr:glutathione S-transferase family protein [Deltaproteobacteria bacterium]
MDPIILHQFQISPYCEKIRKVLDYKGLPYVRVEAPMEARPEIKRRTGRTKVPVIVVGDQWVSDSTTICEWLDERFPDKPIHPKGQREGALNALLEDWADEAFSSTLQPFKWCQGDNAQKLMQINAERYPRSLKNRALQIAGGRVLVYQMRQLANARGGWKANAELFDYQLDRLNELLAEAPFIFGPEPMSADFAVYGLIRMFEGCEGFDHIERRPHVIRMVQTLAAVPSACKD